MGSCIRRCPFHVRVCEIGPEGTTLKPEMAKHNRGVKAFPSPAALCCSCLSTSHPDHVVHSPVLRLPAHRLSLTSRLPTAPEGRVGHGGPEVGAASPKAGVNPIPGEGLTAALAGTQVVIDLANAPAWEDQAVLEFFETSGRNLLAAEAAAGVQHHVAVSIVGTDRTPDNGYFRAKVAQEHLIEASGLPYTIIRATQFMEFLGGIAEAGAQGSTVQLSPGLFQPIAADDVAAITPEVAPPAPRRGIAQIAGPERAPLDAFVARHLQSV